MLIFEAECWDYLYKIVHSCQQHIKPLFVCGVGTYLFETVNLINFSDILGHGETNQLEIHAYQPESIHVRST